MNKHQKLVQEQFLNNEEAIIKRLKAVYARALKDIEKKAQALQDDINRIGTLYKLSDDADERAVLLSMQQSKVYQKQYQDALKKQVGSIFDNLQVEEFQAISEYIEKCYEDGFIGTMFDLQGQGIPLCFPLDQEAMVRAVQLDSKISQGLYTRLGEDVKLLKTRIAAEVSRGISTGETFAQVAQQLSAHTNIGMYNAMRIARTEGHRVAAQSSMHACYKAKDSGADVVKQWDSAMDKRTRKSHQHVDGEIRELDEPFSNGLMFPGDPDGVAEEVIHCRCALLQRARWALDEEELETLKKRAEYYGLDKTKNFEDFKKKYLKATKAELELKDLELKISEGNDKLKELEEQFKQISGGWTYKEVIDDFGSLEDFADGEDLENMKVVAGNLDSIRNKIKQWTAKLTKTQNVLTNSGNSAIINKKLGFKAISGKHSIDDDIGDRNKPVCNPNYSMGREYQVNCQRCVQTYEFRRRGYDVEALPKPKRNNKIHWGNECFTDVNGNAVDYVFNQTAKQIKDEVSKAPDGARYSIYIQWKGSRSAHVFIAEKANGVVRYVDPQSGNTDVSNYFARGRDGQFAYLRLDDKQLTSDEKVIKATMKKTEGGIT